MLARIWTTSIDPAQAEAYEQFARRVSLPMFQAQAGFKGIFMLRREEKCLVVSLWEDQTAVDQLALSETYNNTVARILAQGFLVGEQTTETFDLHLLHVDD